MCNASLVFCLQNYMDITKSYTFGLLVDFVLELEQRFVMKSLEKLII
jgi:hypothetical protein